SPWWLRTGSWRWPAMCAVWNSIRDGQRLAGLLAHRAARNASQFPAPGATVAALGVLSHRHHAIPAGVEPAAVAVARHRAGCALGGGAAVGALVAGFPVQKRRRGRHLGAACFA